MTMDDKQKTIEQLRETAKFLKGYSTMDLSWKQVDELHKYADKLNRIANKLVRGSL